VRYRVKKNEVLDAICAYHYGRESDYTEMVLRSNPKLAQHGTHIPAGLYINLPEVHLEQTHQQTELWSGAVDEQQQLQDYQRRINEFGFEAENIYVHPDDKDELARIAAEMRAARIQEQTE
jgi:phage tail protein X